MDIMITTAVPRNAENVYKVFKRARAHMTYLPHLHTDEETEKFIAGLVKEGNVSIAKIEERIVGFTELRDGWIEHLYVDPEFQNQGIGTSLMNYLKQLSPSGLTLWVFEENKGAIAFYEREGFVLVEKRDLEHANNEEHLPDRKYHWASEVTT